jgi:hypothetical protein
MPIGESLERGYARPSADAAPPAALEGSILRAGQIYRLTNPVELLAQIAEHTDRMYLWTCYCDADLVRRRG